MPSTDDDTGIGPTYEFVVALYVAAVLTAGATTTAVLADAPTDVVVMIVGFGGLGAATVVGVAVGVVGLPERVHPRPLYTSGLAWLPMAVGGVAGSTAFVALLAEQGSVLVIGEPGALLVASFGGFVVAGVGWVLLIMVRNAEARARLAASDEVLEWQGRPGRTRRRQYYLAAGAFTVLAAGVIAVIKDWWAMAFVTGGASLATQGVNHWQYWLGDDALVYGNPQVRHLLDHAHITSVTHMTDEIRIARAGWRPALTVDTGDVDDPEAVVAALTRPLGTRGRPR